MKPVKVLLICLGLSVILLPFPVFAAANTRVANGITVSPAVVNVNLSAGEQQAQLSFKLTNNELTGQTINLRTADFRSLNYTGGLLFVGSNASQLKQEYGLAHWLSLPQTSLNLGPKQTANVIVNINNTSDLAPGGHYGGLLFSLGSPSQNNAKVKVGVQPVASALIFVTKLTGATFKLGLSHVTDNHNIFNLPTNVNLLFYNNGNSQVTPRGYITLTDSQNNLVAKGIINIDSGLILPGNSRYFSVPLTRLRSSNGIGNYKLRVNFTFDGLDSYRTYQQTIFLGAPILLIELIAGLLAMSFGLYKAYKWHKRARTQKPKPYVPPANISSPVKLIKRVIIKSVEQNSEKIEIKRKTTTPAKKEAKKITITEDSKK